MQSGGGVAKAKTLKSSAALSESNEELHGNKI
jgi:hypothetical protein